MNGWGLVDSAKRAEQAVKQLTEAVASMPADACSDLLILPLYAAMPLELQVRRTLHSLSLHIAQCWPLHGHSWQGFRLQCPSSRPALL